MVIDKTTVTIITKGLVCLGFMLFTIGFILYLVTNMSLYGNPLNEGDKVSNVTTTVINNQTVIDLGTIELKDDNLEEQQEIEDEIQHATESAEWLHNSAYVPNDNNTTCNPAYKIMEQWISNKFKCYGV